MNWKKIDFIVTIVAIALITLAVGFCLVSEMYLSTNEHTWVGVYSFIGLCIVLGLWKGFVLFTNRYKP